MLAQALNVSIEELLPVSSPPSAPPEDDPGYLKLMNLSALTFWFIPLALWIYRKNRIQGVGELGKRILNFQIILTLVTYGLAYLSLFSGIMLINPFTMLSVILALLAANTVHI